MHALRLLALPGLAALLGLLILGLEWSRRALGLVAGGYAFALFVALLVIAALAIGGTIIDHLGRKP